MGFLSYLGSVAMTVIGFVVGGILFISGVMAQAGGNSMGYLLMFIGAVIFLFGLYKQRERQKNMRGVR